MLDGFLFQNIATARLEQCASFEDDQVFVRLPDGVHEARLTPAQWNTILERHRRTADESRRQLVMLMIATIPLAIAVLGIIYNVPWLAAAFDRFDQAVPLVLPLLLTSGLPIVAIWRHALKVQRSIDRARIELKSFPAFAIRHRPPPREAGPVMKLALFVTIPTLVIQAYGSMYPDAYRNTPWTGTQLGGSSLILVLVLAAALVARRRAAILATAQPAQRESRIGVPVA